MPHENQYGGDAPYPALPSIKDHIGENPARFLWYCDRSGLNALAAAVVRGIEDVGRANAWIAAERKLSEYLDAAPRQAVIDQISVRRDYLLVQDGALDPETFAERHDRDLSAVPVDAGEPAGETASAAEPSGTADSTEEPASASADPPKKAVASDGGATATEPEIDEVEEEREAEDGPFCPVCQDGLVEEDVAGATGLWCQECGAFRGRIEDGEAVVDTPDRDAHDFSTASDTSPSEQRDSDQTGIEAFGGVS